MQKHTFPPKIYTPARLTKFVTKLAKIDKDLTINILSKEKRNILPDGYHVFDYYVELADEPQDIIDKFLTEL